MQAATSSSPPTPGWATTVRVSIFALAEVLPWFLVMSAGWSVGLMEAVVTETGAHLATTRLEHLDQSLAEQPVTRPAGCGSETDQAAALLADTFGRTRQRS